MAARTTKDSKEQLRLKGLVKELLKLPQNRFCSECGQARPSWASVSLGVFFCINCSGFHRKLGVHISKVRSTTMDNWTQEFVDFMTAMGNEKANAYWEAKVPENRKPGPNDSTQVVESYIKDKYERRAWAKKGEPPTIENWSKSGGNANANNNDRSPPPDRDSPAPDEESDEEDVEKEREREREKEREKAKKLAAKKSKAKKPSSPSSSERESVSSPKPVSSPEPKVQKVVQQQKQADDLLDFGSASSQPAEPGFDSFFSEPSPAKPQQQQQQRPSAQAGPGSAAMPQSQPKNDIMSMFNPSQPTPAPQFRPSMYNPGAPMMAPVFMPQPYPSQVGYPPMYVPNYGGGFPAAAPPMGYGMSPVGMQGMGQGSKKVSSTSDVMAMF